MANESGYHESSEDLLDDLKEDKQTPEVEAPEEKELPRDGEDEDESRKEEEEQPGDEGEEKKEDRSKFGEITKKYPNLFKDFPNLRHVFFHEKEYRELFPTIDEAKEAVEDLAGLQELEKSLASGDPGDVVGILDSMKELGDDVVPNFAINFLPSLRSANQDLYYQAITPVLVDFTRSMFDAGTRNENENLRNAAAVAALYFFGDPKVASGEKEIKLPERKKAPEPDSELEKERRSFRQERYTSFYNDIIQDSDRQLENLISDGLDPKNNMTDGMKELVTERVVKEISKALANDSAHTSKMDTLWKKAGDDNFSGRHKAKIIAAYLEAAREILPRIRSKVRANALGIRERRPENRTGETRRRIEPESTTGGGRQSNNGKVNAKNIDWRKTSDLDFLKDNITLKEK